MIAVPNVDYHIKSECIWQGKEIDVAELPICTRYYHVSCICMRYPDKKCRCKLLLYTLHCPTVVPFTRHDFWSVLDHIVIRLFFLFFFLLLVLRLLLTVWAPLNCLLQSYSKPLSMQREVRALPTLHGVYKYSKITAGVNEIWREKTTADIQWKNGGENKAKRTNSCWVHCTFTCAWVGS